MDSSPLHTKILKKGPSRRILSSSDEEDMVCRPVETHDTPYFSSPHDGVSSGYKARSTNDKQSPARDEAEADEQGHGTEGKPETECAVTEPETMGETLIEFTYSGDSPWDSDDQSSTSTLDFKRGKHPDPEQQKEEEIDTSDNKRVDPLTKAAIQAIRREGLKFRIPQWITKQQHSTPSAMILADSQLKHWLDSDKICEVEFREGWLVKRWIHAIRTGDVRITGRIVVIYLEGTRNWGDVLPVKNALHTLCKGIRHYGDDPHIFIANHLPRITSSPVGRAVNQSNFVLHLATRSIGRAMGRVYELSIL